MTSIKSPKSKDVDLKRAEQRRGNFYKQTIEENSARLNGKSLSELINEVKFLQSELLMREGDVYKEPDLEE